MAKLNLKTRESKASVASSPSSKSEDKPITSVGSSFGAGTRPGSRLAGKTTGSKQITPMGADEKSTSSLHSFSKFAASGAGNSSSTAAASLGGSANPPMRFSDRYGSDDDGGNSLVKVIAFIVVIIAIGLAVIYFIQSNLVDNGSNNGDNQQTTSAATTAVIEPGLYLSTVLQPDADSDGTAPNSSYQSEVASIGSVANENENALIDELIYEAYDSFTRLTFRMLGVDEGFPGTQVEIDDEDNIVVTFSNVSTERERLLQEITPSVGNILSINAQETEEGDLVFTLEPTESSEFYVSLNEAGDVLELDIKTETQLTQVSNTSSSTTSTASTSTSATSTTTSSRTSTSSTSSATSTVSGSNQLTNEQSQNPQEIVIAANNVDAVMTGIFYRDLGPKFEFDWIFEGTQPGDLPDVQAEIIQANGNFYIELTFENVFYDSFYGTGKTDENFSNINLQYSNLKRMSLISREGQTSVYRGLLGFKGDYRLTATEVDQTNNRRVVRLEVFD